MNGTKIRCALTLKRPLNRKLPFSEPPSTWRAVDQCCPFYHHPRVAAIDPGAEIMSVVQKPCRPGRIIDFGQLVDAFRVRLIMVDHRPSMSTENGCALRLVRVRTQLSKNKEGGVGLSEDQPPLVGSRAMRAPGQDQTHHPLFNSAAATWSPSAGP